MLAAVADCHVAVMSPAELGKVQNAAKEYVQFFALQNSINCMRNVPQERHIRAAALAAHVYARPMHMPATHKRHIGTRHSIKQIHILYSHPAIKGSGRNRTSRSTEQEEVEGGGGRWSTSTRHVHQSSWLVTRQRLAHSVRDLVTCTTTPSTYVGIDLCRYTCVTDSQQPADALCATPLDSAETQKQPSNTTCTRTY